MAACMTFSRRLPSLTVKAVTLQPIRFRWKPPDKDAIIYPSYAQRLAEWNSRYIPPASQGVNIGFYFNSNTSSADRLSTLKKWTVNRKHLEQAARLRNLKVDIAKVREEWLAEMMPEHVRKIASHYGVYRDLFDGAHFYPVVPLDISFDYDEEFVTPVRYGNIIPAAETAVKPFVSFASGEDYLWTLIMTSPDGNLEDNNKELLHWFVANIPGKAVEKGETLCDYLQPFPPRGAGFLRYVFVLYKQEKFIDLKKWKKPPGCSSLRQRSFSTLDFYRENEKNLTPAGLSFFQSEWDKSVTTTFHHVLDMKEPVFEFLHPPEYFPEQMAFPHRQPFNFYLDNYRDEKDIQEEVLKEKLKCVDISKPFSRPTYPNAESFPKDAPSWLKVKIQYMRLGKHQWRDLYKE